MIECYKYLTGVYSEASNLLPRDVDSITRGHSLKLKKLSVKTSVRQNFFAVRVVNAWNSLPEAVVSAPSLNSFKNRLDKAWAEYKYSLDSKWFEGPKPARTNVVSAICDNQEDEATSARNSTDRLKGNA